MCSVANVHDKIARATGRELPVPGRPQYEACESFIIDSVNQWETPVAECVELLEGILLDIAVGSSEEALLNEIDSRFITLRERAESIINDFIHQLGAATLGHAKKLCSMQRRPFTFNDEEMSSTRATFISTINGALDPNDKASKHQQVSGNPERIKLVELVADTIGLEAGNRSHGRCFGIFQDQSEFFL